jgi:pilus assembly protein Flp/PilA
MLQKIKNLVVEEEGQGLSEYGLILAGIVAVAVLAVTTLSTSLNGLMTKITTALNAAIK